MIDRSWAVPNCTFAAQAWLAVREGGGRNWNQGALDSPPSVRLSKAEVCVCGMLLTGFFCNDVAVGSNELPFLIMVSDSTRDEWCVVAYKREKTELGVEMVVLFFRTRS